MTFRSDEARDFHLFLDKFKILDLLPWDERMLDESIQDVVAGLDKDRIDYCWMRFSINKYLDTLKWRRHDAIKFVHDRFEHYAKNRVGLVLSLKYESPRSSQRQLARTIGHPDVQDSVIGIDLVGDELFFDHQFYGPILKDWSDAGKVVMAHVGEFGPATNVLLAINHMYVTDVCHGIKMAECPSWELDSGVKRNERWAAMDSCRVRDVCFHMSITPNYMTGVWTRLDWHPIVEFVLRNLKVTIGTDDPVQCANSLDGEYEILRGFGLNNNHINRLRITAEQRTQKWRLANLS